MGHLLRPIWTLWVPPSVCCALRSCAGKPAAVVVNERQSLAANLIEEFRRAGCGDDFIEPDEAEKCIDKNTLLVIVDTHLKAILESPELYRAGKKP